MLELLESITYWHWIILALVLLGGEALGAAGFMIGVSLSAFAVAALMAIGVLNDWQHQFLLFALFSVIASVIFWKFFRCQNNDDEAGMINDRAAQLIGRKLTLVDDVEDGLGRIQIGDTFWKVVAEDDLEAGTKVEVYASEGMTLLIRKL
ncbi:NfeD family protein [Neptuniibacter sp. QD48_11]|uniref:NfeD family protein n=1 Tax=unclassified Neptuniibacter TaxID=2630693 RepID=UPI0039F4C670